MTRYTKLAPAIVAGALAGYMSWHALYGWAMAVFGYAPVAACFPIVVDVLAVYSVGLVLKRTREQRAWAWPLAGLLLGLAVSLVGNYAFVQHWAALVPPVAFFVAFELARQELAHADDTRDAVADLTVARDVAQAEAIELRADLTALSEAHDDATAQAARLRAQLTEVRQSSSREIDLHVRETSTRAARTATLSLDEALAQIPDDARPIVEAFVLDHDPTDAQALAQLRDEIAAQLDVSKRTAQTRIKPLRELDTVPA